MFPDRLRLARKKAGLSLHSLAEKVRPSVSSQAIGKYERGQMMPSSSVLLGLSEALGVSLDFLMSGQVAALQKVEFRKHSDTSARDRALAEALVIERLEDYLAIESILEIEPPADPFVSVRRAVVDSFAEVERAADDLRALWQLGADAIPSVTDLLERYGIKVVEADLPERFDGLSCGIARTDGGPDEEAVIVSSRVGIERKRFNLAHELAHRMVLAVSGPTMNLERAMHRFAGAFLAPAARLKDEVGVARKSISYHELVQLKHAYGMSASAMLMRLKDLQLLPESFVTHAFRTFARSWRSAEPDPIIDDIGLGAFEKPLRYENLVYRALSEGYISTVRAAQLLHMPVASVEEQLVGPPAS